jgi:hypothetical protein
MPFALAREFRNAKRRARFSRTAVEGRERVG